jgi:hypothetical protein
MGETIAADNCLSYGACAANSIGSRNYLGMLAIAA